MKITHVYPQAGAPLDREQTPVGNGDTEREVWEEIRTATMRDEGVLFIETHQFAQEDFLEELRKGQFDRELVKVLSLDPLKKTIHIPARGPSGLRGAIQPTHHRSSRRKVRCTNLRHSEANERPQL